MKYLVMKIFTVSSFEHVFPGGGTLPLTMDVDGLTGLVLVFDSYEQAQKFCPDDEIVSVDTLNNN